MGILTRNGLNESLLNQTCIVTWDPGTGLWSFRVGSIFWYFEQSNPFSSGIFATWITNSRFSSIFCVTSNASKPINSNNSFCILSFVFLLLSISNTADARSLASKVPGHCFRWSLHCSYNHEGENVFVPFVVTVLFKKLFWTFRDAAFAFKDEATGFEGTLVGAMLFICRFCWNELNKKSSVGLELVSPSQSPNNSSKFFSSKFISNLKSLP